MFLLSRNCNLQLRTKVSLRTHSLSLPSRDQAGLAAMPIKRPDPELLPVGRPRCPKCAMRMLATEVSPGPEGFEHRRLECLRCGHVEENVVACDPIKPAALGWNA